MEKTKSLPEVIDSFTRTIDGTSATIQTEIASLAKCWALHFDEADWSALPERVFDILIESKIDLNEAKSNIGILDLIASAYLYDQKRFEPAIELLKKALKFGEECNHFFIISNVHRFCYFIANETGDYKSALEHLEKYCILTESIATEFDDFKKAFNGIHGRHHGKGMVDKAEEFRIKNEKLRSANLKLKESENRLKEINATKDKFFGIIAHDIKNPLGALRGTIEFLIKKSDSLKKEQLVEFLSLMDTSASNLYTLLENLLTWARSQTGNMPYKPETFSIYEIVEDTLDLFSMTAGKKNIELIDNVPHNLNAYGDMAMISTVLRNLVSNAIKFSFGGGRVVIEAEEKDGFVEIAISDQGIGIQRRDIEKLFRIDIQYSTLGTNDEQGTGLGLNLSKEFVQKNGGKIWVESKYSKGSKFYFTVPSAP